jgi:hypothetical protein
MLPIVTQMEQCRSLSVHYRRASSCENILPEFPISVGAVSGATRRCGRVGKSSVASDRTSGPVATVAGLEIGLFGESAE